MANPGESAMNGSQTSEPERIVRDLFQQTEQGTLRWVASSEGDAFTSERNRVIAELSSAGTPRRVRLRFRTDDLNYQPTAIEQQGTTDRPAIGAARTLDKALALLWQGVRSSTGRGSRPSAAELFMREDSGDEPPSE